MPQSMLRYSGASTPKRSRNILSRALGKRKSTSTQKFTRITRCIGSAFPPQYECDLYYNGVMNISVVAGIFVKQVFRCNSVYDPDYTSTGNSCLYFPTLATIYDHYTVLSSKCDIQLTTPGNIATGLTAVMYIDDDVTSVTSLFQALSRPYRKATTWNMGGTGNKSMSAAWSSAVTFGNAAPWTDPNLKSAVTTNPTEESFFVISFEEQGAQTFSITMQYRIKYRVVFQELKTLAA